MITTDSSDAPNMADSGPNQAAIRNVRAVSKLEQMHLAERTWVEWTSDLVTKWAGSPWSILFHILWFGGWIAINSGVSAIEPFDPYPFGFMTVLVSLEAIFLSLFILKSQNTMQRQADARSHLDLQINLLAEEESTKTLAMLQALCSHFNISEIEGKDLEDLKAETNPEAIVTAIKETIPQ